MSASALPPRGFVGAGTVARAQRAQRKPRWGDDTIVPLRYAHGVHYQHVVEHALAAWANQREGVTIEFGPWFQFVGSNQPSVWRWCQPDVLIVSERGLVVVLEVKLAFEARAWWQLDQLYRPVVEKALKRTVRIGVVCKSYDPAVSVPANVGWSTGNPAWWLDAMTAGPSDDDDGWWPGEPADLHLLQWKRPSIDSASSESTARITSANQLKAR